MQYSCKPNVVYFDLVLSTEVYIEFCEFLRYSSITGLNVGTDFRTRYSATFPAGAAKRIKKWLATKGVKLLAAEESLETVGAK